MKKYILKQSSGEETTSITKNYLEFTYRSIKVFVIDVAKLICHFNI